MFYIFLILFIKGIQLFGIHYIGHQCVVGYVRREWYLGSVSCVAKDKLCSSLGLLSTLL